MAIIQHTLARRISRPLASGLCALTLAVALTLAGCGGQAHHNTTTGSTSQQTTGTTTGSANPTTTTGNTSSAAQQVINLDNQIQNDASSMDTAQNDANTDYSSQDTPQQPSLEASSAAPVASAASLAGCNGNVKCIISFGDARISDRLTALSTLSSKANAQLTAGHITSDQNNTIQSDVSTNQSNLNTLKSKLDAETTATAARQDVLSIYVTYRIYAVVLPRDYREIVLDVMMHIDGNLRSHQGTIQQAISQAPASEQAHLNALFSDFKSQLTNAESQFDAASSQIPSLTPQNYDSNRSAYDTAFQNYKDDEQTAHTDLKNAINDLHQIAQILKSNATPTPSA